MKKVLITNRNSCSKLFTTLTFGVLFLVLQMSSLYGEHHKGKSNSAATITLYISVGTYKYNDDENL